MLINTCGCGCDCPDMSQPATKDNCLATLEVGKIGALTWIYGLNDKLCFRYQRLTDLFPLRDCDGNRIASDSQIITCANFGVSLCNALNLIVPANPPVAVPEITQLVGLGANGSCFLYTIPTQTSVEVANTVTDTSTIDFSCSGTLCRDISGSVKVSDDVGNILVVHTDGLYVPTGSVPQSTCDELSDTTDAGDAVTGTVLFGLLNGECRKFTFPEPVAYTVADTPSLNLTLTGTQISGVVVFDPATDLGTVSPSGILITCAEVLDCAPAVTVTDTDSINFTLTGQNITADVKLATNAGNDISFGTNGIYLSVCNELQDFLPSTFVYGQTELIGTFNQQCFKFTLPAPVPVTVLNTNTIDMILVGQQIHSIVNIAPVGGDGQLLTEIAGGLIVTCEAVQDCIFTIPNNFWQYNDPGDSVLFSPSTDAGQAITTGTDGKPYVPSLAVTLSVLDTDCLNLTYNTTTNVLSGQIIISPDAGNQIQCTPNGLFVPNTAASFLPFNNLCLATTVNQPTPNQFQILVSPIISPDAGNIFECRGNGIYVSEAASSTPGAFDFSGPGIALLTTDPLPTGAPVSGPVHSVTICNPSLDRNAVVDIIVSVPAFSSVGGTESLIQQQVDVNIAFPSKILVESLVRTRETRGAAAWGFSEMQDDIHFRFQVLPGECGTVTAQEIVETTLGTNSTSVTAQDTFINVYVQSI